MGLFREHRPKISTAQQQLDRVAASIVSAQINGELSASDVKNIRHSDGQLTFNIGLSAKATVSVHNDQLSISVELPTSVMDVPVVNTRDIIALIKTAVYLLEGT
jgi:hypothetical protein